MKAWIKWGLLGILLVPLNALCHELGHYLTAFFLGADNIVLHYASVSADADHLSKAQRGLINIAGPVVSYLFLIAAIRQTRYRVNVVWFILGSVTTLRGLVNLPFLIGKLKGVATEPNFDEYNFSVNMDMNPFIVAVVALSITLFACIYFTVVIYKKQRITGIIKLWMAVILGLLFWGVFGKYLFP